MAERGVIAEGAPALVRFVAATDPLLRRGGDAEGRRAGAADHRRRSASGCEPRVHRSLSGDGGARALHGAAVERADGKEPVRIEYERIVDEAAATADLISSVGQLGEAVHSSAGGFRSGYCSTNGFMTSNNMHAIERAII